LSAFPEIQPDISQNVSNPEYKASWNHGWWLCIVQFSTEWQIAYNTLDNYPEQPKRSVVQHDWQE
jgi:hypothetical protein